MQKNNKDREHHNTHSPGIVELNANIDLSQTESTNSIGLETVSTDLLVPSEPSEQSDKKTRKRKKRKNNKNKKRAAKTERSNTNEPIASNRTIDGMYRNAYKAQMDMLALLATKANIMISLNGLLISILIISGTHFVSMHKLYSLPITVLLAFSAMAIMCSVLAARTLRTNSKYSVSDFESQVANLLIFSDYSSLSKSEYVQAMASMQQDNQRIYRNMAAHLHELGASADDSSRKLYYSYTLFVVGIFLSLLTLGFVQWITLASGP